MAENKRQIAWINGAKFIAILAVLVDHTYKILYTNKDIAYASYFSVELFIILSGMTSYLADTHHITNWWGGVKHSCRNILTAYCISVVVYMIINTHGFDFLSYLDHLIHFNIVGAHYFVLLYIQLMAVNGFLFNLLQKCPKSRNGYICEAFIMLGIIILSIWTTNHTNILNVFGGGGKLFGGTYLILYYFGMLVMKHGWLEDTTYIKSITAFVAGGCLWFILWRYTCINDFKLENYMPFGNTLNPPGITFMTFGVCMLFITFGMFTLLEQIQCMKKIVLFVCGLGCHTLYIFLYHSLIESFCTKHMQSLLHNNIWLARVVFFTLMIMGPILIEICIGYIQKLFKWVFIRSEDDVTINA